MYAFKHMFQAHLISLQYVYMHIYIVKVNYQMLEDSLHTLHRNPSLHESPPQQAELSLASD